MWSFKISKVPNCTFTLPYLSSSSSYPAIAAERTSRASFIQIIESYSAMVNTGFTCLTSDTVTESLRTLDYVVSSHPNYRGKRDAVTDPIMTSDHEERSTKKSAERKKIGRRPTTRQRSI